MKQEAKPFRGNVGREVRQVAFGLALLRQLLDEHAKTITRSADIPGSAIGEAYAILDHLLTGRNHPVAKFLRGVHSGPKNRAPVTAIERVRQQVIVGIARAYKDAAGVDQSEGFRVAARVAEEAGIVFDSKTPNNKIRMWDRDFRERGDQGPDAFASKLSEKGGPQEIVDLGRTWVFKLCTAPMPPTNQARSKAPISGPKKRK